MCWYDESTVQAGKPMTVNGDMPKALQATVGPFYVSKRQRRPLSDDARPALNPQRYQAQGAS